jgi:SAM-dependent methyltransferase
MPPFSQEKTFSTYTFDQGKAYAEVRRDYHPNLYRTIINQHTSNGGQFNTILDVGCGPGIATRGLSPHFTQAIGIDPSLGMIETARSVEGSQGIRFDVSTAEELGRNLDPSIPSGSVDLITAGTAAHWFDMSRFWARAAEVLKPGGSVALWTTSSIRIHPSMPNYVAIQAVLDEHEENLKPYFEPGNLLTRNLYRDLLLPWTSDPVVDAFDEKTFFRREWDGSEVEEDGYFVGQQTIDLDRLEKSFGTSSPITRWRQANPEAVGTEKDIVKIIVGDIRRLLHEAGVEQGKEVVKGALASVLLVVKKKA